MTKIYMIRHGESLSNLAGTFTGSMNSPLSETGILQAKLIAAYFEGMKVDKVYASDLERAKNTVSEIANSRNLKINTTDALREIYAGKWEGRAFLDIEAEFPEEYAKWRQDTGNSRCTEGESASELSERVFSAVSKIAEENEGKTVVIGTHATPIRAMETIVTLKTASRMSEISWVPNASISLYTYHSGEFTLSQRGITEHLDGLITELPKNV